MQITIHKYKQLPNIDYRELKPLQGNLKEAVEHPRLQRAIEKRGFKYPLFVWVSPKGNFILDGHQRVEVLTANDMNDNGSYEIPYVPIEAKNKKDAMAQLLEITSQYAIVTEQGLREFLQVAELPVAEVLETVSLPNVGDDAFGDGSGSEGEEDEGESDDEQTPEADTSTPPKSKPGSIYQLGDHRLLCGDATDLGALSELMDGKQADLVFTDPPYNVDYEGKTKDALKIQNDKMGDNKFYTFLLDAFTNLCMLTREGGSIYITHSDSEGYNFRRAMMWAGWLMKQCLIWNKNTMVLGRQDYQWKHEPILYGWKPGAAHYFIDERNHTTVWDIPKPSRSAEHPTMKPVDLIKIALRNSSKKGALVLDTFGGSGSTLAACQLTGRTCYMSELDPVYVDVIRKRYAQLIGKAEEWEAATPEVSNADA
jgi:DNA modification methylase